jgi:hypothetical protein
VDADQVELAGKLASPAYTPGRRDLDALLDGVLAGALPVGEAIRALLRARGPARERVLVRLPQTHGPARAELVRLLARLSDGDDAEQRAVLLRLVEDADPRAARQAVQAVGKLSAHAAEVGARLRALWPSRPGSADRRALAEALGKLGDAAARPLLDEALARLGPPGGSPDAPGDVLRAALERARLMLTRSGPPAPDGPQAAGIDLMVPLPEGTVVSLRCRAGLGELLRDELQARGLVPAGAVPRVIEPGGPEAPELQKVPSGRPARVELVWSGPLLPLLGSRLFSELALPLVPARRGAGPPSPSINKSSVNAPDEALIAQAVAILGTPRSRALLAALGARVDEPLRFRIELCDSGPRRALIWRLAQALARECPTLCNDPKGSPWELGLRAARGAPLSLELLARKLVDPRFSYRVASVPASSQPTLAAALARLVDAGPADTVWDPFVGAGAELIEVALLGRCRRLHGTDLSDEALAAAAQNVEAARASGLGPCDISLRHGDALTARPAGVTCIVTNPPMGRRVRRGDVTELLGRFVRHAAAVLPPGGRLAWLDPQPQRHAEVLRGLGLRPLVLRAVDMHGFYAQLELWQKP